MTGVASNLARGLVGAVALVVASAELAAAAPARVASNTNLRQGPGVNFPVIATVPVGSVVEIIRCGAEWCNVMAGATPGYMIARNLGVAAARPVAVAPAPIVVAPAPVVVVAPRPYYYGPRVYYGPRYYGWRRW